MDFAAQSPGLFANNRLLATLFLTGCIGLIAGIVYVLVKNSGRVRVVLQSAPVIIAYRIILTGSAVLCLALSLRPREELGLASMYIVLLWPLLIAQLIAGLLPWSTFVRKHGSNTVAVAVGIGVGAFFIDSFLLQLTGYVGSRL
jgi:hypothetical protein